MNSSKQAAAVIAATPGDLRRLLGDLDASTVSAIMALAPSAAEVEEAAMWLAGEGEAMPVRHQPQGKVKAILDLAAVEEDEGARER